MVELEAERLEPKWAVRSRGARRLKALERRAPVLRLDALERIAPLLGVRTLEGMELLLRLKAFEHGRGYEREIEEQSRNRSRGMSYGCRETIVAES